MTEDRRKEIALLVVEKSILERGLKSPTDLKRDLGNGAKDIGIDAKELLEFYRSFVPKLYGRMFGFDNVRIEASNI